jgi:antirestriction protein ArdC
METTKTSVDVYQIITDRIIEQLGRQTVPWRKPWTEAGHPQNMLTKKPYRGTNVLLLASLGYTQNYFLTLKQVNAAGGTVRKGEKGNIVVFWKKVDKPKGHSEDGEESSRFVLRYYYVFNVSQCDDLPEVLSIPYPPHAVSQIGGCDEIIERMPNCPTIRHGKGKAYYNSSKDYIGIPEQGSFVRPESYYSTLFHELIHSTGHRRRLDREGVTDQPDFGSPKYALEELVAEIGACYLNSVAGIIDSEFETSKAYINGWTERLQNDKTMIVRAATMAQRATDYILNVVAIASQDVPEGPVEQTN